MCFSRLMIPGAYVSRVLVRYVSELSYIHTKLMIVDDCRVIVCMHSSPSVHCLIFFCVVDGLGEPERS
jgi:hypothetical protein